MSLFKSNKYTARYYEIIAAAPRRTRSLEYAEKHHIIPKFCGGSNSRENIVLLSARNHYRCHKLLPKMVRTPALIAKASFAWVMMSRDMRGRHKVSASDYAKARQVASKLVAEHRPSDYITPEGRKEISRKNTLRLGGKRAANYGTTHSHETRTLISRSTSLAMRRPEVLAKIRGAKSVEHRKALSEAARLRTKLQCKKCKGYFIPQMLSRWHNDNCRQETDLKDLGRK